MVDKKRNYNIESLQNKSTKFLYQQTLNNKLNQNEFTDTEERYNYLKSYIHEAAKEALGEKEDNKGRKTISWDAEIEKERQNKKQLLLNWVSTKDYNEKVQHKMAQAKIRRTVTNHRNIFRDKKCLEIQLYLGSKKSSDSWKFIKNILPSNSGKSQLNKCRYMGKILLQNLVEDHKECLGKNEMFLEEGTGNIIEIDSDAVKHAIMRMKTRRAAGPGDILIELIKSGGQKLLEMITILHNKIINGEKVPEERKVAIITSIHMKGDKRKCGNYRVIAVTSTFSRIYGHIEAKLVE